jgi:hypothetical protein
VVDQQNNWFDHLPQWITAVASLIAVLVAFLIAKNQNRLQKTLADSQREIQIEQIALQKMQLEQQAQQLKKDLLDRRFEVFTAVDCFITYVIRSNGKIELVGPGEYRQWREIMERAQMLFGEEVYKYLGTVDKTARDLYVVVRKLENDPTDMEAIENQFLLSTALADTLREQRAQLFRPYLELFQK